MDYVETFQQDSLTARAIDPGEVRRDLELRSSRFREAADAIEERWSQPAVDDHELTVVKRYETVLERARQLVRDAEIQATVAVPAADFPAIADDLAVAHDRGVLVRVTVSTANPDEGVPEASAFAGVCTEARHRPTPSAFLVVVDRTWTAFMPTHQQTSTSYGLIVNDNAHTSMFQWVFATVLWGSCEVFYRERPDDLPRAYVDIRHCLEDLEEPVDDGATVEVDVIGHLVETGERVECSGTVRSLNLGFDGEDNRAVDPVARPSGPLSFTVETDDGETYDVGGWGAQLEDVEATRVTVTGISRE